MVSVYVRQTHKKTRIALRAVFGIGPHLANQICDIAGVSNQKIKNLTPSQIDKIQTILNNNYFFGSELKKMIKADVLAHKNS